MSDHKIRDHRDIPARARGEREELRPSRREQVHVPGRPSANKTEIKIAVEAVFDVKVTNVNTINRQGKKSPHAGVTAIGKRPDTKRPS